MMPSASMMHQVSGTYSLEPQQTHFCATIEPFGWKTLQQNLSQYYYRSYIEDTYLQFRSESHVDPLLNYLSEKHANINFRCERKENDILPFLDIKKTGRELETAIYRKPTLAFCKLLFTGLLRNFLSFVPNVYKFNLISTLVFRVFRIGSNTISLRSESGRSSSKNIYSQTCSQPKWLRTRLIGC